MKKFMKKFSFGYDWYDIGLPLSFEWFWNEHHFDCTIHVLCLHIYYETKTRRGRNKRK